MARTDDNITRRPRVSSWLYTTLGGTAQVGLSEHQPEALPAQPGDRYLRRGETGRDRRGVVSPLLIAYHGLRTGDRHPRRGIDEVLKQMPRLRALVAPADPAGQQAVQAAGHQRQ